MCSFRKKENLEENKANATIASCLLLHFAHLTLHFQEILDEIGEAAALNGEIDDVVDGSYFVVVTLQNGRAVTGVAVERKRTKGENVRPCSAACTHTHTHTHTHKHTHTHIHTNTNTRT